MNVLFFFTHGTSLKIWSESGYIDREFTFFESMYENFGVKFILFTFGDSEDEKYCSKLNFVNVIPVYKYIKKRKSKIADIIFTIFKLKKILNEQTEQPDLIKTNQLYGSWLALIAKFIVKKPLIVRTGYDLFLFSVKDKKNIFKILTYYLLTFTTLNFSNLYTVTSKNDFKFISRYYLFKKKKLKLRNNWVPNLEETVKPGRRDKLFLAVGRLEEQKDYQYLINAFTKTNFQLDIIGRGSLRKDLEKISNENINFLDNLSFYDLNQIYKNYTFYISSTKYEGNPKSILEAMSKGCVVIAPNIINISEIIENNRTGILYSKRKDNLIDVINSILNDMDKIELISRTAQEHTKKYNSLEKFVQEEFKDYEVLVRK